MKINRPFPNSKRIPKGKLPKLPKGSFKVVKKAARSVARVGAVALGGTVGGGVGLLKGTLTSPLRSRQLKAPKTVNKALKIAAGVACLGAAVVAIPVVGPTLGFAGCAVMLAGAAVAGPALGGAVVAAGETLATSAYHGATGAASGAFGGVKVLLPLVDRILPPGSGNR